MLPGKRRQVLSLGSENYNLEETGIETISTTTEKSIIGQLSQYIAAARRTELPTEVSSRGRQHILDAIAAMVSGSALPPGRLAIRYIEGQGGAQEARVIGSAL